MRMGTEKERSVNRYKKSKRISCVLRTVVLIALLGLRLLPTSWLLTRSS